MSNNKFLDTFRKSLKSETSINFELMEPSFWISTGNYTLNKILSGEYRKGIPQGRIAALAGPSFSGKTFVASNIAREALDSGVGVLYIDTENAVDKGHFDSVGIDIDHPLLQYADAVRISDVVKIVQGFIKVYKEMGETTPYLIVIDSLDMLQTDGDADKYEKGEIGGDQGQQAKQLKKMLGSFVQDLKRVPMSMICTKQVYINQDPIDSKQNPFKFTPSLNFAFSQILIVSKLLLKNTSKDKNAQKFNGITLKADGFKTRFTQPFQKAAIEVPYEEGIDPYSGIMEIALSLGIITGSGWYQFGDIKFQGENGFKKHQEAIFAEVLKREAEVLDVVIDGVDDLSDVEDEKATAKRREKLAAAIEGAKGE